MQIRWDKKVGQTMRGGVTQNRASKGGGGMEVIVEFLDGDPDKPIVTGCVYNGKNDVPYPLPEHKTRSTFKTQTHQGDGFNELRFEDANGREEIFLHAQKDRNEKTLNNHTERIDNNWVQSVGHNKAIEVNNNHEEVIGGNVSIFVGPQNIGTFVSGVLGRAVEGISNVARVVGLQGVLNPARGNYFLGVEKSKSEVVGIASNEVVGVSKTIQAGRKVDINAGQQLEIEAGRDLDIRSGQDVLVSGDELVEISSGATRIVIRENGDVLVQGKRIAVDASEQIDLTAGETIRLKAPQIDLN